MRPGVFSGRSGRIGRAGGYVQGMSEREPPAMPGEELVVHRDLPQGRVRSRRLGERRPGVPPVVVVMGMAVSDYLMPALAVLGEWTEAHLVELPGFAGSGEPRRDLDVPGYGRVVAQWLDTAGLGRVILAGHSSGTQIAAHAAGERPKAVLGLVLASPTVDPMARSVPRLLARWRLDARYPTPGLQESHVPQWRRAGVRRISHLVRVHLRDRLEDVVPLLPMPVLALRGDSDRLLSRRWAEELVGLAPDGRFTAMPGPHTFVWNAPHAWSAPIRALSDDAATAAPR